MDVQDPIVKIRHNPVGHAYFHVDGSEVYLWRLPPGF
jgi:hypothetical protein